MKGIHVVLGGTALAGVLLYLTRDTKTASPSGGSPAGPVPTTSRTAAPPTVGSTVRVSPLAIPMPTALLPLIPPTLSIAFMTVTVKAVVGDLVMGAVTGLQPSSGPAIVVPAPGLPVTFDRKNILS